MAEAAPTRLMTEEEFLAFERTSEVKHEFFRGEVFAMAGAKPDHSLISANSIWHLRTLLGSRGCQVYDSDLYVKIEATGLLTHPDVTVVCGERMLAGDSQDILVNPSCIVEVLSESTEAYDRGTKFDHYRLIPSLMTYLLISQIEPRIEQFLRENNFVWQNHVAHGLEATMELPALGISLSLAEIFSGIKFGAIPKRNLGVLDEPIP
jgi:Uma2 family endonuclease